MKLELIYNKKDEGFEELNATVRWTVARDGLTERILYFCEAKMQTNPSSDPL